MDPACTTALAAARQLPCVVNCKVFTDELAPPSVPVTSVTMIKSHIPHSLTAWGRTEINAIAAVGAEPVVSRSVAFLNPRMSSYAGVTRTPHGHTEISSDGPLFKCGRRNKSVARTRGYRTFQYEGSGTPTGPYCD
jgi:hypothetical protein